MLLLFSEASADHKRHSLADLFSPDKLFDTAQHLLIDVLPKVAIIVAIAWVLIRVLTYFTDRMARMAEKHAAAATRISQARTLSSVVRATGVGVIGFLAVLQILPMIGFNLAPLLASAGVAGVAVGLACQTVVKDCLNGMLVLVEDQYNVGDVIKIAGLSGQVEAMSLRKTMLRDGDGTLYIIPNSQITTVANQTRDFSVATINVDVDFSVDSDEVIKVLTETAMSVRNDPEFKDAFLKDPTLLGVDSVKGSVVTYPVIIKTLANQQWGAKRELQRRIRAALVEHDMLPGDPNRVYNIKAPHTLAAGNQPATNHHAAAGSPDPTTLKPQDINPFTGEGM
ncbi:mechanosensitive ion channel family protein [Acidipila sp. EB88]|uniref:mechanosensitive ion channel family protein n=1 Tax=Acidipila sp. EB88 TaxID=2305226 RepID=UPI000F5E066E|nr:mechanosensitive ion channel family protein [Acidipila sp. EB88]RRA49667.1 mechanosensitive ion channel family protein [Acidipila sp. EB88]